MSKIPVFKDEPASALNGTDSDSRSSSSNNSDDSDGEEEVAVANSNDAARSTKRRSSLKGNDEKKAKFDQIFVEKPELDSSILRKHWLDEVISWAFFKTLSANQNAVSSSHEELFDKDPLPNIQLYSTALGTQTSIDNIQAQLSLIKSYNQNPSSNGDDMEQEQIERRMVEFEELTSVHNQLILDAKKPKEIQLSLNPLQRKFDDRISDLINDFRPGTLECVRLRGPTGSGKTTLFEHIAKSEKSVSVFVSPTNLLNDHVLLRLPSVKTYTFFKLISLFFYERPPADHFWRVKDLLSLIATFDREKLRDLYEYSDRLLADTSDDQICVPESLVCNKHKPLTIFLDDISLLTESEVIFSMMLLRRFCKEYNAYVILIIIGDFHQIPPVFNTNTEIEHGFFIENFIKTENDFKLTQSYQLENSYMEFLNWLCKTEKGEVLNEIRSYFTEDCFNRKIEYSYPGQEAADMFELYRIKSKEFTRRLPEFCQSILKYRVFAYRNHDAYHHMLLFAFMIYSQSKDYVDFHFPEQPPNSNLSIDPVVPLIRFFPYRFVGQSYEIPRLAIVHLIDWNENNCCCFYPPECKLITLNKDDFRSNLLTCQFDSNVRLSGFPLELDYASTAHTSSGRTNTNSIIIHLPYLSREELYVSLSRIKNKEGLFTFFN